jgi:hypothetical protein
MSFVLVAEGAEKGLLDSDQAQLACELFIDHRHHVEVQSLLRRGGAIKKCVSGSNPFGVCDGAATLAGEYGCRGIYLGLNPIKQIRHPARKDDVVYRRHLMVDIDPIRPKDTNASQAEHDAAQEMAFAILNDLAGLGWPAPAVLDSGNGYQLIYRINLSNSDESREIIKRCLLAIGKRHPSETVTVDPDVFSAVRYMKFPGTMARKGPHTDERPHRMAQIVHHPEEMCQVTKDLLVELAGPLPEKLTRQSFVLRVPDSDGERYGQAALDRECQLVAMANDGQRNNQLNRSAFALFQLVAAGALQESTVTSELLRCAESIGLTRTEAQRTIESGKSAGLKAPRQIPEKATAPAPTVTFGKNGKDDREPKKEEPKEPAAEAPKKVQGPNYVGYTLEELLTLELPEPKWVVPGLLSEGLNLLAGPPKAGKSWLALNLAITVAAGGMVLGEHQATAGNVLYISLEDRTRRVQGRARKILAGKDHATRGRLMIFTEFPRQDAGGLEAIQQWVEESHNPSLVIIDVWQRYKPNKSRGRNSNAYEQDYADLGQLKGMLDAKNVSCLCLHHLNKSNPEDVVEKLSGSMGIGGCADGIMVLTRQRSETEGELFLTGRDIEEKKFAMKFDSESCTWTSLGEAEGRLRSVEGKKITEFMRNAGHRAKMWPKEIAESLGLHPNSTRTTLCRLVERGILKRDGGRYHYPEPEEVGDAAAF